MRIGLVIHRFDPALGGVEQWTYQYAAWLLRQGHEVHVVTARMAPRVRHLDVVPHELGPLDARVKFPTAAERRLRELGLDIIHDNGVGWYCDVFQPHGGSRRACFEQGLLLHPTWMRPAKRAMARVLPRYRRFDHLSVRQYATGDPLVIAISQMVFGHLITHHGVREERIRLVYNGVDVERFSPQLRETHRRRIRRQLGVGEDEALLLIVAHNFELKGVPALIRAAGRLRRRGIPVRLAVAGGGRAWRHRHLARRCGVEEQVSILGAVDDPTPYYAAADVYVQPTFYDPCSLVVLEALACGLPVVTSRFNGAAELIEPGKQGNILDDPHDPEELAEKIDHLLTPERRVSASAAARRLAEEHSLERNFQEVLGVYDEVLRARRRAA